MSVDQSLYFIGAATCVAGGMLLVGATLACAVVVVNTIGSSLWKKLLALHDVRVLQQHLAELDERGKTASARMHNLREPRGGSE